MIWIDIGVEMLIIIFSDFTVAGGKFRCTVQFFGKCASMGIPCAMHMTDETGATFMIYPPPISI